MHQRITSAMAVAATLLTMAACADTTVSDTSTGSSSSAGKHNDADVSFAQDMIPHHAQAIVMSNMAKRRATDPKLRQLAADIRAAQGPEITQMSGWLRSWGEDVPKGMGMNGDHNMGDMGDMGRGDMPGMMTDRQRAELDDSDGSAFDRMWLQMMIRHHEGAITMAKIEQQNGQSKQAIELAKTIESAQTTEIALMKSMLER